jgi:hypothetical protein
MALTDKIPEGVQRLPIALQAEGLDFVEYLLAKAQRGASEHDEALWSPLSLTCAMRGMEAEDSPPYTKAALQVIFS